MGWLYQRNFFLRLPMLSRVFFLCGSIFRGRDMSKLLKRTDVEKTKKKIMRVVCSAAGCAATAFSDVLWGGLSPVVLHTEKTRWHWFWLPSTKAQLPSRQKESCPVPCLTGPRVNFWKNSNLRERRVPSPCRVVRRVPHQPMHPSLHPQPAVRRISVDKEHDAAQAGLVARTGVQRSHCWRYKHGQRGLGPRVEKRWMRSR